MYVGTGFLAYHSGAVALIHSPRLSWNDDGGGSRDKKEPTWECVTDLGRDLSVTINMPEG